jgi:hypothetical protein
VPASGQAPARLTSPVGFDKPKTEVAVKGADKPKKLDKKKAQKTLKEKRAEKKAKKSAF